ncbi:ABC transporter permease [Desulfolutivibrio sulfoxidireducens]|uniref:ABC transporter permease n=1 Tax=Desulfolutivibrio sulfoxidireducens TaxID=2773299 RepID=UPI00159D6D8D|nr:ABC transporter permease [Desulfolutivibrio sulfoxidireducens]QLA15859.1 ABC transporter permease subunit [Desulfolutivibrio sulfoxidireducens]QLA20239.1 ABC transporter permease subunit [Desulfolutivibrio sulfoxidireducens]
MNSQSARRIAAIMVKESLQILRDPSSILIGFILPVFLTLLSGYSTNLDIMDLSVGLVLEDDSPEARSLAAAFAASTAFAVRTGRDRREFADDLTMGRLRGLVVIPQTFGRDLARADESVPFQVIADGSEPNTATFLQNYAQGVWRSWMEIRAEKNGQSFTQAVELVPRTWFNQDLVSLNSLLPGGMAINLTLIGALLTALVVAREWERGTMEALLATPIGPVELLAGKLIPYFALGLGALGICMFITLTVFHVPYRGSVSALLIVSSVFLVSALSLGLFISTAAKNQFVASQIAILSAFLPAYFLSGYVFEPSGMPLPVRLLTHVIAAKYYVSCLKTLFLAGDSWPLLWPNIGGMAAIAVVLLGLTLLTSRRRVA